MQERVGELVALARDDEQVGAAAQLERLRLTALQARVLAPTGQLWMREIDDLAGASLGPDVDHVDPDVVGRDQLDLDGLGLVEHEPKGSIHAGALVPERTERGRFVAAQRGVGPARLAIELGDHALAQAWIEAARLVGVDLLEVVEVEAGPDFEGALERGRPGSVGDHACDLADRALAKTIEHERGEVLGHAVVERAEAVVADREPEQLVGGRALGAGGRAAEGPDARVELGERLFEEEVGLRLGVEHRVDDLVRRRGAGPDDHPGAGVVAADRAFAAPAVEITRNPVEPDAFAMRHGATECGLDECEMIFEAVQGARTNRMIEVGRDVEVLGLVSDLGHVGAGAGRGQRGQQQGSARAHGWPSR